jgi:hypothetical protein
VMFVVPAVSPVTTPVALTVAIAGALLLHVPPATVLLSGMVSPLHTLVDPLTTPAVGAGFIVVAIVRKQPLGRR